MRTRCGRTRCAPCSCSLCMQEQCTAWHAHRLQSLQLASISSMRLCAHTAQWVLPPTAANLSHTRHKQCLQDDVMRCPSCALPTLSVHVEQLPAFILGDKRSASLPHAFL